MKAVITVSEKSIEANPGETLASVLNLHGEKLDMPCAGKGTCKSCAVLVNGKKQLACQTVVEQGMRVELIQSSQIARIAKGGYIPSSDDRLYGNYGLSIDIGTTTICAALLRADGDVLTVTRKNPQTMFGADVISRIEKSLSGGTSELAACIRTALQEMAEELASKSEISVKAIDGAVITGNTVMLYLLTGENPDALSHAPFVADRLFGEYRTARELELPIAPDAKVYLTRCISAFIGGDVTTAIVSSGMLDSAATSLLVDIGTNGEIALWHDGELVCCSTAAGPAFEGAGISHGVYGVEGAIDHVWQENGEPQFSTIHEAPAVGVCGSGIIDALSVMLKLGILDETGAFSDDTDYFELSDKIGISATDVRKLQLAKGSIRAGIETLLEVSGVNKSDVSCLYIAGGFGSYVDLENAAAIGLIPNELARCSKVVGNAAHTGASMLLQNKPLVRQSEIFAKKSRTIALDANPVFTAHYMTYMTFE